MKNRLPFLLSILFLFTITLVNAQSISGKILSTDNEAIPYATIQIGESHGTISNEEGNFTIATNGFLEQEIVKISYLGFETIEIPLNQFTAKDYILKEHFNVLSEVYLSDKKLTIEEILEKVRANITTNYSNNSESEIFYRTSAFSTPQKIEFEVLKASEISKKMIKSINNQFEDLRDFSENQTSSNYKDILLKYSRLDDSTKVNVIKATKLINASKDKSTDKLQNDFIQIISTQLDSTSTYKVKTGLFKIEDSLKVGAAFTNSKTAKLPKTKGIISSINDLTKEHAINESSYFSFIFNENKNEYVLDEITSINNELVYKISFTPKRKSEKFEGVFYVNANDFAVIKVDYNLSENRSGKSLNLKLLMGIKFVENKINGSVIYKKGVDEKYKLQLITCEKQQYAYLSRPLKFIKNVANENDKKTTFKFKFKVEITNIDKQELYFITNKTSTETTFNMLNMEKNYSIDQIEAYNPEIWKDYKIITPIKSIKNYHLED
ncbi:carboxypeptidase-like regulatory domain-containing protein [Lacinutrix mariniflava]|uniref:carboxypeptidase-like regulatory domain-containing protein n=1 Tax=Lacinutrix mariniflava TaxID=342955 RepID=UPI0006E203F6|nr:carboxypeptidase-like regulatory domain-containing protein [Lacinutrix mariniflava]